MAPLLVALVVLGACTRAAAQDATVDRDVAIVAPEPDASSSVLASPVEATDSSSAALEAPEAAATAAPEAAAPGAFAFGLQLAADGTFTEPALTPQVGFALHIRLPDALSLRVVPSIGYVRMQSQPLRPMREPPWSDDRLMAELRVGLGYSVTPWLEGRLFVAARTIHRHVGPNLEGYPPYWVHRIAVGGGTEWTLRPVHSSGFEITASLGLGGIGTVLYSPYDGAPRFNMNALHAHGALALGWLFGV